ncbi:MAG: metallophosphoesterase, partial [Chloroflexi bacterium]|nr:metallophosphoesterase [Chloroflexota bacterium]
MFSLFKIFTLATAVVVIVDLLLVSRGEFSDQLAPQENTVVSLFSPSDDTTTEPSGFADAATRRGYATKVNTAYAPPRDNTAVEPSGFADAATRRGYASKVNTAYAPPRDNTAVEPSGFADAATPSGHAFNVNIPSAPPTVPPPNFTVAFIGDQGSTSDALAVLALIKSEGADMVLHQGDLDYNHDPDAWDQRINDVLGPDFPYFASIGNHDRRAWIGYQRKLTDRLARIPEADCTGDLGVKSSCRYRGLFFILSGVGTRGLGHESYIREELAQSNAIWRICSWHKNHQNMQIG